MRQPSRGIVDAAAFCCAITLGDIQGCGGDV